MLKDYTGDNLDPVPLLYQTGYLTIAGFDPIGREYTLSFPNEEVKYGFVECLMPEYVADGRKIYKIGVSFDSATRKLTGWETAEQ